MGLDSNNAAAAFGNSNATNLNSVGSSGISSTNLNSVSGSSSNSLTNYDTTNLDDLIQRLQNEYNSLNDKLKNDDYWYELRDAARKRAFDKYGGWGFKYLHQYATGSRQEANRLWDDAISKRDTLYKQLEDAKAQKASYLSNLAAQKQKYVIEAEALKNAGINNPYFALKGGPISGSAPFSLAGAGAPNYNSSKGEKTNIMELLKLLIALGALPAKFK